MQKLVFSRAMPAMLFLAVSFGSVAAGEVATNSLLASQTRTFDPKLGPMCLHTKGKKVLDAGGKPVWLYGVNIASLEWSTGGENIEESVNRAINDWKVNLIRLPLAQDYWFGKTTNQTDGGAAYRILVDKLVDACAAGRVYINLDLHWSDCGRWVNEGGTLGQHSMPDKNSITFWQDMATRYKNQPNVIFDLYNEPHDVSFAIWRDGGTVTEKPDRKKPGQAKVVYEGAGLQMLYDAVRATGATNVVAVAGLDWGYDLSGVLRGYAVKGSNLIYETHPYQEKKNWDKCFGETSWKYPVYMGEWGFGKRNTNGLGYAQNLMQYAQKHKLHWTAWDLHTTAGPPLIKNWDYEPTVSGQFVKEQLAAAAAARDTNK
jgi:hypothetical protein